MKSKKHTKGVYLVTALGRSFRVEAFPEYWTIYQLDYDVIKDNLIDELDDKFETKAAALDAIKYWEINNYPANFCND